jgi:hypothetical protein
VPEPVLGDGRQVGAGQRGQPDVFDGTGLRLRQVVQRVVIAAGEQPHDGQADQAAQQRPDDETADPVGPLPVVDGHEHGPVRRGAFDDGGNPFGEQERLVGQSDELLVLLGAGQGAAARAQRGDHRSAGTDLSNRLAPAGSHPYLHPDCLPAHLAEQCGLADSRRATDRDQSARPVVKRSSHGADGQSHRFTTAAQRSRVRAHRLVLARRVRHDVQ